MTAAVGASATTGRQGHYAEFYGLTEPVHDGRRVGWVHGNCQAESLRLQLEGPDLHTVRVPPVHELVAADLPHLRRLCERTDVLVSQPVRADYHDLPLGVAQLAAAVGAAALVARFPVVRFAGLFPTHVIIRPPSDPSLTPPLVAYHDIGTLWNASGAPEPVHLTPERVRAVAAYSVEELRRRERHHDTIPVSDLFDRPRFSQLRTLNHPGNELLLEMAVRVRRRLGLTEDVQPIGRPLLDAVHAPRSAVVAEAFDLDPSEAHEGWRIDGRELSLDTVREAHLAWYAEHPDAVAAGLLRHAALLPLLGLGR